MVILDVMMPKMSGVDVLDSLEALTSDPSVKSLDDPPAVLVITSAERDALPDSAIYQHCPRMVRRVFRKPLEVEELAKCVETYLPSGNGSHLNLVCRHADVVGQLVAHCHHHVVRPFRRVTAAGG